MSDFRKSFCHRTELALGPSAVDAAGQASVIIFGLGGVGSCCAEALLRSGIGHLCLVDSDIVCASNLNRQLQATSLNIGQSKAEALGQRLMEINPEAKIWVLNRAFSAENKEEFHIEDYDFVIDAIDTVSNKLDLIELCLRRGIKFLSSMGAGARSDPSQVRVGKLSHTRNCTLARVVRQGLRKRRLRSDFLCVYSLELPLKPLQGIPSPAGGPSPARAPDQAGAPNPAVAGTEALGRKKQINGSLLQVTGVFGLNLAALIMRDIAGICPIPRRFQAD